MLREGPSSSMSESAHNTAERLPLRTEQYVGQEPLGQDDAGDGAGDHPCYVEPAIYLGHNHWFGGDWLMASCDASLELVSWGTLPELLYIHSQ
ncbi:hypothetical protein EMCRGX_G016986 [Ephydatia muelleri]